MNNRTFGARYSAICKLPAIGNHCCLNSIRFDSIDYKVDMALNLSLAADGYLFFECSSTPKADTD